jgi:hemerythrin-like metal-binding protein
VKRLVKVCQEWNDDYVIGDLLIDGEHKKIIEMACTFARLVESGNVSYRDALEMAREVANHISAHFSHEELLLTLYNTDIQEITHHKDEHAKFKAILSLSVDSVRDVGQGEEFIDACIDLTNKLYDMITEHIATVDKDTLAPCIAAHEYSYHRY